jgi:outer membrane beta-barrel protein
MRTDDQRRRGRFTFLALPAGLRRCCALLALGCGLLSAAPATAQEAGQLLAIQQRKYGIDHELSFAGSFAPLDAFQKGLAPEVAYSWHLDDQLSWEVLRAGYAFQQNTGLYDQLVRDFGVIPTAFESLRLYAKSSLLWAPLYGKFAVLNHRLVHLEGYLIAGATYGHFTGGSDRAGPEAGAGLRLFLGRRLSLRLEARDTVFLGAKKANEKLVHVEQVLFFTLGLSVAFGGTEGG